METVYIKYAAQEFDGVRYRANTFPSCSTAKPGFVMAELPFGRSVFGRSTKVIVTKDLAFEIHARGNLFHHGINLGVVSFVIRGTSNEFGVSLIPSDGGESEESLPVSALVGGEIRAAK